jgi:hypothetical protein
LRPSGCTQGRRATIRTSRRTSRPSYAGFITCARPPLSPKPRWSNDTTPYPASSQRANAAGSVVREPPQPWLCMIIGTLVLRVAAAGLKSV